MRKITAIPLFVIYLIAAIGATFQVHLCQGQVVSIKYADSKSEEGCCGKEEKKSADCCEDIQITLKSDPAHAASFSNFHFLSNVIIPGDNIFNVGDYVFPNITDLEVSLFPNPPPGLWEQIPLFLLHRSQKLDC